MNILNLFIDFVNDILNFSIFDIKLSTYLITITIFIVILNIVKSITK